MVSKESNGFSVLLDENVPLSFYFYLRFKGVEDVLCIPGNKDYLGLTDNEIKEKLLQDRILVTSDKGFLKSFNGLKLRYDLRYESEPSILRSFKSSKLYQELKTNGKELNNYDHALSRCFEGLKSYELMFYSLYDLINPDDVIINIEEFFRLILKNLAKA
jgi:hypothetical protein